MSSCSGTPSVMTPQLTTPPASTNNSQANNSAQSDDAAGSTPVQTANAAAQAAKAQGTGLRVDKSA